MGGRWTSYGIQFSCFAIFILVLEIHGCLSLNSEGFALLKFRENIYSDPSGALANWNPIDCDPCMWSGVHCLDGKVNALDLNGRDLEGALSPELGNLAHLRFLDLSKNNFSGTIPREFGRLMKIELLDLRNNSLSGTVPRELGELRSLKRLLIRDNRFEGSIPLGIGKLNLLTDLQFDDNLSTFAAGIGCLNRKFVHCLWPRVLTKSKKLDFFHLSFKGAVFRYLNFFPLFKIGIEHHAKDGWSNLTGSPESGVIHTVENHVNKFRRILAEQSSNFIALPPNVPAPSDPNASIPSRSSGSFPAIPTKKHAPGPSPDSQHTDKNSHYFDKSEDSLEVIIGVFGAVLLLIVVIAIFVICRKRAARAIAWKTGLSGQLQKAFVTGVPKLNRAELETACEDFSNIINTYDDVATSYKGTLSSGVEITVASTAITSVENWSKRSELAFRKKIDNLSRVNHKNFVNLIGYCEEDEPFTRMMVFEYAPNGTLFEHLHVQESEHLDWNKRMRIIMGVAYCLQSKHDLNPPVPHFNLTSKDIFLTEDYAAKIADIGFWSDFIAKPKSPAENESEHPPPINAETNVQCFGILLLEVISGMLPYSEEHGNIMNWAAPYLNDRRAVNYLIDPTLKSFKDNELDAICNVIQSCTQQDARKRPRMKEVIQRLRQEIDISPEMATPRLSPLWWAELEILSAETT